MTVLAPAALVAEHFGPTVAVVTPIDDTSSEVVAGANSLDEMALYLGLAGHDLVVHEPTELASYMAALGARLIRAGDRRSLD